MQSLVSGSTYHYRLAATNANGTNYGADATFTTPGYSYASPLTLPPAALLVPTPIFPPVKTTSTTPKALTQAQKLAKALKACEKDKARKKRATCDKVAHKKYGPLAKKKSKKT